jgi:hypothetical protein
MALGSRDLEGEAMGIAGMALDLADIFLSPD